MFGDSVYRYVGPPYGRRVEVVCLSILTSGLWRHNIAEGDAKVIILDEPTAGMDPIARAQAGEYIRRKKLGRVVLLVTHFLDEAEKLGDRLMIISDGKLLCSGSSSFLRRR